MFFLLPFQKCLDVYIETVLSNRETVSSLLGKLKLMLFRVGAANLNLQSHFSDSTYKLNSQISL